MGSLSVLRDVKSGLQFQFRAGSLKPRLPQNLYQRAPGLSRPRFTPCVASSDPLLLRVAKGEDAERVPVWLMRQAGRYMADFRKYSDKFPFRQRSETPDIAIELTLQPWRAFRPDGVIFFSDILTPLPALGIEFTMVKGKGPQIQNPVRSMGDVRALRTLDDPQASLPFIHDILSSVRKEIGGDATLLGFIGTPWTLAAYSVEGSADKNCMKTFQMMLHEPATLHAFLDHLTTALIDYACYQIDAGAQVIQLFDSWAHHLSPEQFAAFSLPYAERLMAGVRAKRPGTPLIFHANGGTGKLELLGAGQCSADVLGLDWGTRMQDARATLGPQAVLQGNVDPRVLFGPEEAIRKAVASCISQAGGRHILNVGHGVIQGTPEESVALFCQLARESSPVLPTQQLAAVA